MKRPPVQRTSGAWVKRRAAEVAGTLLLILGVLALFLPGPGLLTIVAGLALLSTSFAWAERLMHPIKSRAFHLATEGVQTKKRIFFSIMGGLSMIAVGIVWGLDFPAPSWWPIAESWWLVGGWATGISIMASGTFALGLIVYSYLQFGLPAQRRAMAFAHSQGRGRRS